jgi:hypothetical protein
MAFFFDMDNPDALGKLEEEGGTTKNGEKLEVKLHNGLEEKLDILLLYNHDNEYDEYDMLEVKERLFSYVPPNNTEVYERALLVGDRIMAVIAGTTQVVSEFEIKFDQSLYSISQIDSVRTLMGAEF